MTKKQLKKEIAKYEKSLLKTYKAMRRNKKLRHLSGYYKLQEIFSETYSGYKTIAKSKMKKAELEKYLDVLKGVKASDVGTYSQAEQRYKTMVKRAKSRGLSDDLLEFIEDNMGDFESFIESKTFKESLAQYEYESDLWDRLRDAKEEEKVSIFKDWLEEKEDLWGQYGIDDESFKYSELVTPDNWKNILKRLSEAW